MSKIDWVGVAGDFNGNFTDTAHWESGSVPTGSGEVATFRNGGPAAYEVDVTSAVTPQSVFVQNILCTLNESSAGSIVANSLEVSQGTASLNGANTFSIVHIDDLGTIEIGNNHALGIHTVYATGALIGTANLTLHNAINVYNGSTFAAAAGTTLRLAGALNFSGGLFHLGSATAAGTVDFVGSTVGGAITGVQIDIDGGHVGTVAGESSAAEEIFNNANHITIASGATLDLGNFSGTTTLNVLLGAGTLRETGSTNTIHLNNSNFAGKLFGSLNIVAEGSNIFSGKLDNTAFTMGSGTNTLNVANATGSFFVTGSSGPVSTVVIDKVGGVYENFQAGHLKIETNYSFAHDTVTFAAGSGTSLIADVHNHLGTVVRELTFEGITTSAGIVVGNDGHGNIDFTWSPAETAPHAIHDVLHDAWAHHDIGIQPVVHDPWAAHDFI